LNPPWLYLEIRLILAHRWRTKLLAHLTKPTFKSKLTDRLFPFLGRHVKEIPTFVVFPNRLNIYSL